MIGINPSATGIVADSSHGQLYLYDSITGITSQYDSIPHSWTVIGINPSAALTLAGGGSFIRCIRKVIFISMMASLIVGPK